MNSSGTRSFIFDIETTGLDMYCDVLSLGYIILDTESGELESDLRYFAIEREVPLSASKVNGLTKQKLEALSNGHTFMDYADELLEVMRSCDVLVGHNSIEFDIPRLRQNMARCGVRMVKDSDAPTTLTSMTDLTNIGWKTYDTMIAGTRHMPKNTFTRFGPNLAKTYNWVCEQCYHKTTSEMNNLYATIFHKTGQAHQADFDVWMTYTAYQAFRLLDGQA